MNDADRAIVAAAEERDRRRTMKHRGMSGIGHRGARLSRHTPPVALGERRGDPEYRSAESREVREWLRVDAAVAVEQVGVLVARVGRGDVGAAQDHAANENRRAWWPEIVPGGIE